MREATGKVASFLQRGQGKRAPGAETRRTCTACVHVRIVGCQLVLVHVPIFDSVSTVHLRSAHSVT